MHTFLQICGVYSLMGLIFYLTLVIRGQSEFREKPVKWFVFMIFFWSLLVVLAFVIARRNKH